MIHAIILAAGLGDRLGELTTDRPKAMVPVAGRELILRVMDFLDHPNIASRTVITGYRGGRLSGFLKEQCPGVATLHNPHFEAGSILSLATAIPAMRGDILLMNVDHIYPRRMLPRLLETTKGITAICDFDRPLGPDDMKVHLRTGGTLAAIRKTLSTFDGGYIGMTTVGAQLLPRYQQAISEVIEEHGDGAPVEWVLGHLAHQDVDVSIGDVSGIPWLEVDTPEDLAHAEATLREIPEFLR
ncbi:MAG: phosphocholine cytidylyltransferase family protein [Deltaproteobacteria bacterium]|nr:phosphocholine cytidylyltransferase family protein [Deltaproteobacteria bacterium]